LILLRQRRDRSTGVSASAARMACALAFFSAGVSGRYHFGNCDRMIRALVNAPSVSCSFSRFPVARPGQRYTLLGALDENGKFLAGKRWTLYHCVDVYPRAHFCFPASSRH
jgi:hypothetical protein